MTHKETDAVLAWAAACEDERVEREIEAGALDRHAMEYDSNVRLESRERLGITWD